jgi:hypothetical protein
MDYSRLNKVFGGRYYFHNEKLVGSVFSIKSHKATQQKDAIDFLKRSKKYSKLLRAAQLHSKSTHK